MTILVPGKGLDALPHAPIGPAEVPIAVRTVNPANWGRGDVLLFHARKFGIMTWLIHLVTRSRWNHAALYLGDGQYVEATSSGVRVTTLPVERRYDIPTPIDWNDEIVAVHVVGMYDDEDDLNDALAWAAGRVGTRYGYFNAFFNGLRHVFPGFVQVKFGNTVICSELVAEALERAGFDFHKDTALVSPGDLAEAFGEER